MTLAMLYIFQAFLVSKAQHPVNKKQFEGLSIRCQAQCTWSANGCTCGAENLHYIISNTHTTDLINIQRDTDELMDSPSDVNPTRKKPSGVMPEIQQNRLRALFHHLSHSHSIIGKERTVDESHMLASQNLSKGAELSTRNNV